MNNHLDVVRHRLQTSSDGFDKIRRKIHELRRIVAGDLSPIVPQPQADDDSVSPKYASNEFYDFIITYYAEGKSNKILSNIKNLMMQTGYYFPQVEFNNLTPNIAALNTQYCSVRLGDAPKGCSARDQLRMSLLDYMIGGIGWVKACVKDDRPAIIHCDSLDMTWDRDVRLPCDIRWASCRYREPLHVWIEMFGSEAFKSYLVSNDRVGAEDILELEWYYDVEGEDGNWVVFSTDNLDEPIHTAANPYFYFEAGEKIPFLPYEPMYLLQLPSLRVPIGLVEQQLPSQIAQWQAEEYIQTVIDRGKPFYTVPDGLLDPEEQKKFERGDIGAVITTKLNQGQIQPQQGIKLDNAVIQWHQQNSLEGIAQGGSNPYAAGAPVAGVSYAAEVNAIQGQSGLMAGNIAKDLASFWQRAIKKFLAVAKQYDDQPILLTIDGTELEFNSYSPVGQFLRPDADIVIQEDTMQFKPRAQKIQEATLKLQTAMSMAQAFPNAPAIAFADWLEAIGEKNLDKWLQPGPTQPIQQGPQGDVGAMQEQAGQLMLPQTQF